MKIAILTFSSKPIPSPKDRIFAPGVLANNLAENLIKRGHQVDLFAPKDSKTKANLMSFDLKSTYSQFKSIMEKNPVLYNYQVDQHELFQYSNALEIINRGNYDIVHANDFRKLMYFSPFINRPIVYTYHGSPQDDISSEIEIARAKKYFANNLFVAISHRQTVLGNKYFNFIDVVHHGIDLNNFSYNSHSGDKLLFFGRIMERKGPDIAIKTAIKTGKELDIVGDYLQSEKDMDFFHKKVEPLVNNNKKIRFFSHVPYNKVANAYQDKKALLFPIQWEEPFGLVMIEAMACGTPVIAYARGSVPEVIKDGETGFIINSSEKDKRGNFIIKKTGLDGMIEAVKKIYAMPEAEYCQMRQNCRKHVEQNFTIEKMVDGYESVYKKVIENYKKGEK